jgi:hypothetical protein
MKKSYWLLGLTILVACGKSSIGTFEIMNNSGQEIYQLSIDICGQHFEDTKVAPNKHLPFEFKLNCEGHYLIVAKFNNGAVLRGEVGYVTVGIDSSQKITINSNGISLSEK